MDLVIRERLQRWEPTLEIERASRRLTRQVRKALASKSTALMDWRPRVDVDETSTGYEIRVDLPSVRREDVHITRDNGMLTIEGSRQQQTATNGRKHHRIECNYGSFKRRFTIPKDADASAIDASLSDGVLRVTIPKTGARGLRAREVEVH